MLSRSGSLPREPGWTYELKLDGFRAIVRAGDRLEVRSRRGWNMTPHLPELERLPAHAVLDGELVALGEDGWPSFPRLCQRMLQGDHSVPVVFVAFGLLELDGQRVTHMPLGASGSSNTADVCQHGPCSRRLSRRLLRSPLWQVCVDQGLEGVVAKRLRSPYRPGERGWVKVKNRDYWRYGLEVEAALRTRVFVQP